MALAIKEVRSGTIIGRDGAPTLVFLGTEGIKEGAELFGRGCLSFFFFFSFLPLSTYSPLDF